MSIDLNEQQKKVINHLNGPLLVVAGAGTGKTYTITQRIVNMIKNNIPAYSILAVTFTNKAAEELGNRVLKSLSVNTELNIQSPLVGTFHNICLRILKQDIDKIDYQKSFSIYDERDQIAVIKNILKDEKENNEEEENFSTPKSILKAISYLKNSLIEVETALEQAQSVYEFKTSYYYKLYQEFLEKNNALDFDDLLMLVIKLFEKKPEILKKYQNKWQYISVDEYQDTNLAQNRLIELLAKKYQNICVVGDSDQSIYAFRGASVHNILNFTKKFPEAITIKLEQNYRSTQTIIKAANALINNNKNRIEKNMWTNHQVGTLIQIKECVSEYEEAEFVVNALKENYQKQIPLSHNVILYRTNAQSRALEEELVRNNISYKIIGGVKFYSRKEIKDLLAYCRIIVNPYDEMSLERIINVPPRKIGKNTIVKLRHFLQNRNLHLIDVIKHIEMVDNLTPVAIKALKNFYKMYQNLCIKQKQKPLSVFFDFLLKESLYFTLLNDNSFENNNRLENIQELQNVMKRFDLYGEGALQLFLDEVSLIQETDELNQNDDSVFLMTVHSVKGLEFDNVFITGFEEGIFPHERSSSDYEKIEEERRLAYVALTRARENLWISYAQQRLVFGKTECHYPSPFLAEIPENFCKIIGEDLSKTSTISNSSEIGYVYDEDSQEETCLEVGLKIEHGFFGRGRITAINNDKITVVFDSGEIKTILPHIAPIKIIA